MRCFLKYALRCFTSIQSQARSPAKNCGVRQARSLTGRARRSMRTATSGARSGAGSSAKSIRSALACSSTASLFLSLSLRLARFAMGKRAQRSRLPSPSLDALICCGLSSRQARRVNTLSLALLRERWTTASSKYSNARFAMGSVRYALGEPSHSPSG